MKKIFYCLLSIFLFIHCRESNSSENILSDSTPVASKVDCTRQNNEGLGVNSEAEINKAVISKSDSSIFIGQDTYMDHRIFGYERPDINSKKLILFSSFTNDVEGNPFQCPLGAFYSSDLMDELIFKYLATEGQFVKAKLIHNGAETIVYIERNWVVFSE